MLWSRSSVVDRSSFWLMMAWCGITCYSSLTCWGHLSAPLSIIAFPSRAGWPRCCCVASGCGHTTQRYHRAAPSLVVINISDFDLSNRFKLIIFYSIALPPSNLALPLAPYRLGSRVRYCKQVVASHNLDLGFFERSNGGKVLCVIASGASLFAPQADYIGRCFLVVVSANRKRVSYKLSSAEGS